MSALPSHPSSHDSQSELAPRPQPKVNPFCDAKLREEVLKGKGMDYHKMEFDLEHRHVEKVSVLIYIVWNEMHAIFLLVIIFGA